MIEAAKRIDQVVDRAIDEQGIVGTVVMVSWAEAPAYRRAAGFLDREAGTPMPEDAIFRLASFTKPIVAATALALIERGKFGLDDVVSRWLPDFRPKLPDGRTPGISVRQLLTHTSGLRYSSVRPDDPYVVADVSGGLDVGRRLGSPLAHGPRRGGFGSRPLEHRVGRRQRRYPKEIYRAI